MQAILVKPWGTNRCIYLGEHSEVHHAKIVEGGFSSKHRHVNKINHFLVDNGTLLVHFYANKSDPLPSHTSCMTVGSTLHVLPGTWHRFEAVTGVELIETYYTYNRDKIDPEDIERVDVGGIKPCHNSPAT